MKKLVVFLALAWLSVVPLGSAQNLGFLNDAVVANFNDDDMALLKAAVDSALKESADDVSQQWQNEKSGASGSAISKHSFSWSDTTCRIIEIRNEFKGKQGKSSFTYCKQPDGAWKIDPRAKPAAKS